MFCPLCKSEYREGFTICAACNVALIPRLSRTDDSTELWARPTEEVWRGMLGDGELGKMAALTVAGIPAEAVDAGNGQTEILVFRGTESAAREVIAVPKFRAAREQQICPLCLEEYSYERRLCPLCLCDLTEPGAEPEEVARIWSGDHPGDVRLIRNALREAGIPFHILGDNPNISHVILPRSPMENARYAIEVLPEHRDVALQAMEGLALTNDSFVEALPNEEPHPDAFEPAEDLCAKAWSGENMETAEGLRMIFREHEIESRLEEVDGGYGVFVAEHDRERAAALARNVVEGVVPPELNQPESDLSEGAKSGEAS